MHIKKKYILYSFSQYNTNETVIYNKMSLIQSDGEEEKVVKETNFHPTAHLKFCKDFCFCFIPFPKDLFYRIPKATARRYSQVLYSLQL